MAQIHILSGKRQGTVVPLNRNEPTVFGHRPTADVPVDDAWVSWDHAQITWDSNSYWVEDLGSTNGTWINYNRIQRESIKDHDVINLGKTQILFVADITESEQPPLPPSGAHVGMAGPGSAPTPVNAVSQSALSGWPAAPGATPAGGAPAVPAPAALPMPLPIQQQPVAPVAPGEDSDYGYAPIETSNQVSGLAPSAGFQPIGPATQDASGTPSSQQFKLGRKTEAEIEALEALLKTGGNQDLDAFVGDPISEGDLGQELEQLAQLTPPGSEAFAPMPIDPGVPPPLPLPIADPLAAPITNPSSVPAWLQDTVQTASEVPIPEMLPLTGPPPVDELAETKGLDQPPAVQAQLLQEAANDVTAPPPLPPNIPPPLAPVTPLPPNIPPPLAPMTPLPPPTLTPGNMATFPTTPTPPPPQAPIPLPLPNNGPIEARISELQASLQTSEETLADREVALARSQQRVQQLERETATLRSALEQRAANDNARAPTSDGDAARLALQEARVQEVEVERDRLSADLDDLTTQMIDKEDRIEALQTELERARRAQPSAEPQPVASPENEPLEFLP